MEKGEFTALLALMYAKNDYELKRLKELKS